MPGMRSKMDIADILLQVLRPDAAYGAFGKEIPEILIFQLCELGGGGFCQSCGHEQMRVYPAVGRLAVPGTDFLACIAAVQPVSLCGGYVCRCG